jgi:hypothetical protein
MMKNKQNKKRDATFEAIRFGYWGWVKLFNDYKEERARTKRRTDSNKLSKLN